MWVFRDRQNDFVELEDFKLLGRLFHKMNLLINKLGKIKITIKILLMCCNVISSNDVKITKKFTKVQKGIFSISFLSILLLLNRFLNSLNFS